MMGPKTLAMLLAGVGIVGLSAVAHAEHETERAAQFGISADMRMKVKDSYIVTFSDSMPAAEVESYAKAMARDYHGKILHIYSSALKGFAVRMPRASAMRMAQDPMVMRMEDDAVAFAMDGKPSKTKKGGFGIASHTSGSQTTPWGITRVGGSMDGSGLNTYAWVIDTGIDLDHPDLNVNTAWSKSFVTGLSSPDDGNGHGTHVAGTIAAKNNGFGVVGVAAGATLVAVRVLNSQGSGSFSDIIAGVDYVGTGSIPGDIANMSLGGPANSTLDNAIINVANMGVFFSLAAGNESQFAGNVSPARTNHANVYTVSAIDSNDNFASFSNWGNPPVDCAAPGVSIFSTYRGGTYRTLSGTSMAAPHVGGILLINNGTAFASGTANGDPDGNPDPICHK
ncbi:MAG: S8 family peptidase [Alphaproteobacteria bacterium]|nr:MAG: S8 family peptidase [Alphaproteobacteria bacterium]